MHVLLLPFFIAILFVKNLSTWFKMFLTAYGFQVAVIVLVATNVFLGYTLYNTMNLNSDASVRLAAAQTKLSHQRDFWQKIAKEVPGHRQAQEIQKTLAE